MTAYLNPIVLNQNISQGLAFNPNCCIAIGSQVTSNQGTNVLGLAGYFGAVVDFGNGAEQRCMSWSTYQAANQPCNAVMRQGVFMNQVQLNSVTSMYKNFQHGSFENNRHYWSTFGGTSSQERNGFLYLRFANEDVALTSFRPPNAGTDPEPWNYRLTAGRFQPAACLQVYNHKVLDFTDPGVSSQAAVSVPTFWGNDVKGNRFTMLNYMQAGGAANGNRGSNVKHVCTTTPGVDNYTCTEMNAINGGFQYFPTETFGDPGQGWALLIGSRDKAVYRGSTPVQIYRGSTPVQFSKGGA